MKAINEMNDSKPKIIKVFFDERIKDYEILKWNSTNLSKVNSNMMDKYMKCKFVTWNVFNYF